MFARFRVVALPSSSRVACRTTRRISTGTRARDHSYPLRNDYRTSECSKLTINSAKRRQKCPSPSTLWQRQASQTHDLTPRGPLSSLRIIFWNLWATLEASLDKHSLRDRWKSSIFQRLLELQRSEISGKSHNLSILESCQYQWSKMSQRLCQIPRAMCSSLPISRWPSSIRTVQIKITSYGQQLRVLIQQGFKPRWHLSILPNISLRNDRFEKNHASKIFER